MAILADRRTESDPALDNQKFALDQHAIVSGTDTLGPSSHANDKFL